MSFVFPRLPFHRYVFVTVLQFYLLAMNSKPAGAQSSNDRPYKVLTLTGQKQGARNLPQDNGAAGVWQRLLKLGTTASVLHTQAHPDDEHADLLTYLGRGVGCRTALLSLNRGESGANVLGGEAFDHLGILRTEEFLLAAAYYGLDDLYFTRLVDYGYSKRVEETYDKWGRENILRELVRVIRINRPLVIVSRFHGSARDGHGNHQAAGEMSPLAYEMAADPAAFPELAKEGLRPWKALKFYRGGIRPANNEPWHIELNTGVYNPWLGQSYKNFSLLGYSMHRSQVGGNRHVVHGPFQLYYERMNSTGTGKEKTFFDGIDTSIRGIFTLTGETPPEGVTPLLAQIETAVINAMQSFQLRDPSVVIPHLAKGLSATRTAISLLTNQPEALFLLRIKEQQFMDAIHTATGIQVQAIAMPEAVTEARNLFEPQATMGFAVAGKPFVVRLVVLNNSSLPITPVMVQLHAPQGAAINSHPAELKELKQYEKQEQLFTVQLPDHTSFSQPYYGRASLHENVYQLKEEKHQNLPAAAAAAEVSVSYRIGNELITMRTPVVVRQSNVPFGYDFYSLQVAPAIGVNMKTRMAVIPVGSKNKTFTVPVELVNHYDGAMEGSLSLKVPRGWKVQPEQTAFAFTKAGEKNNYNVSVTVPEMEQQTYSIEAVATAQGKTYSSGYHIIHYRDLDQQVVYHPAVTMVKGIGVTVTKNLRIGYVMGAGDEVPAALQQLGAQVQLLDRDALAAGQFKQYDVIMIGHRAYAVRPDLRMYNQLLLNYARNGGHLVVLYQSPEFVPAQMAPYPAQLPNNAEEIAEEDAPVQLLDQKHPVLLFPNKITTSDFEHWVEQRGSKFFSLWDTAYVPIISSNDRGQAPQKGGWLMAKTGKGYYTYFAYAFHRQLPNGVEGAYRLLANIISYGRKPL